MWSQRKSKSSLGGAASSPDAAMDALARLLATRERSVQEASKRLREKGYKDSTIKATVKRALACGLLDDQRFAQGYIKGKLNSGWGARRIEQELRRFGINTEDVEGYPEAFVTEDMQLENAIKALQRHHSNSKNPREAAYRYLVGKGYNSSVTQRAIRTLLA